MRNKSIIQVGVVASADPNQFEEQLNSRLRELADYNSCPNRKHRGRTK